MILVGFIVFSVDRWRVQIWAFVLNLKWLSLKMFKTLVTLFGPWEHINLISICYRTEGRPPTKKVVGTAMYNSLLSPASSKITLFYFFFDIFSSSLQYGLLCPVFSNLTRCMSRHVIDYKYFINLGLKKSMDWICSCIV